MQNSPQEIKSRLDRAVDVDGNVLDMAAVLDIVAVLEQFPLTKEALEKTRIGKTINLLRKKTNNEELARRAKKLVKKWQKLVINHMGCARNTDSPINGNRASPVINGAIRDGKKPEASSASKSTVCKGRTRGVKRKLENSSSDNSPVTFVKLSDESSSRPCTPLLSGDLECVDSPGKTTDIAASVCPQTGASSSVVPAECSVSSTASVCVQSNKGTGSVASSEVISQATALENSAKSDVSLPDCNVDSRTESQIADQSLDSRTLQDNVETSEKADDAGLKVTDLPADEQSGTCQDLSESFNCAKGIDNNSSKADAQSDSSSNNRNSAVVKEDSSLEASVHVSTDNVQECSVGYAREASHDSTDSITAPAAPSSPVDSTVQLNSTKQCDKEVVHCAGNDESMSDDEQQSPKELTLDLHAQAIGINGRFSDDGQWYDWSQVMPVSDGTLNILPYVILE